MNANRYKLRRNGTAWTLTVPASIAGTVTYVGPQGERRTSDPYTSRAQFSCHVRHAAGGVPEIVYRPTNAAARRMLADHLQPATEKD